MKANPLVLSNLLDTVTLGGACPKYKILVNLLLQKTKSYKTLENKVETLYQDLGPLISINYNLYCTLLALIKRI